MTVKHNMRTWLERAKQRVTAKSFFHLHLISDSTGETLITVGRAVAAQYSNWRAIEHITPMVQTRDRLLAALDTVDETPGIVLYTLVDPLSVALIQERCQQLGVPAQNVLAPVTQVFDSYLGDTVSGRSGAQHEMDENYFSRLDAIQFTMAHDDGNLPEDINEADVILVGISRTSKTPTSIYLAQRGVKTVNVPLVPGVDLPDPILGTGAPPVVALIASTERIVQVRENRLLAYQRDLDGDAYVDRAAVQEELAWTRRLCRTHGWPMIDVSKRSIEETSAAIIALLQNRP
ncbi:MAG: pyruvate, water dikinase regulatory protein [Pseudomonadota bacterium]